MSIVNNCMLYLLEIGCLVLVSKKKSLNCLLEPARRRKKKQRKKDHPCRGVTQAFLN